MYSYVSASIADVGATIANPSVGGATAGRSPENRFPEYLAITLWRYVGVQDIGNSLSLQANFNFGKAKNRRGISQVNEVDGPFL
jgi:hypothetical protein